MTAPARVLAIGAHPDDIEFGAGATLNKWVTEGCEVHLLILTDGSKGSWDASDDLADLVETRKREAQAAGGVLGARDVHFLGQVDGELESGPAQRAAVCRVIREARPDVVLGHDPWKHYRLHPDHRHAGLLTVEGVVAARDPHFFPRQEVEPHRPGSLLLFEAQEPDHHEAVTDEHLTVKIAALLEHRSQWRSTMGIGDDPENERRAFEEKVRGRAADAARAGNLQGAAEAFKRIDDI